MRIDGGELLAIGEDLVARHGDRFRRDGTLHDVTDELDMVMKIGKLASYARIERRVSGNACDSAPAVRLLDLFDVCGIQKEFHHVLLRLVHIKAVCKNETLRDMQIGGRYKRCFHRIQTAHLVQG